MFKNSHRLYSRVENQIKKMLEYRAIQKNRIDVIESKENQLNLNIFPVLEMSKVILNQNYKT
jgi:hypothetical protein